LKCRLNEKSNLSFTKTTQGLLFAEILDYQYSSGLQEGIELVDFGFVSTIRFRAINTAKLLSVSLLRKPTLSPKVKDLRTIETIIKLPMEALEFRYGCVAFEHFIEGLVASLVFEMENQFIRPEFEVLKPYFSKVLKTKKIPIKIKLEVLGTTVHSQEAASIELERINQEVVDSLKFQFAIQHLFKRKVVEGSAKTLLSLPELEGGENVSLYQSEEELLGFALQLKNVKHAKMLRFLAQKHDAKVMKIRFVLEPFSFVFLLTGKQHYYLIWETLNTEEATYIWHVANDTPAFFQEIEKIDKDIQQIKHSGRQKYIETERVNFSRILHDYQDEKKGFIKWRDAFEQIIV
jgi:hypothetical protein